MHWLNYRWTDASGQVIGTEPWAFAAQAPGTTATYTLTVDDGHGGTAADSVTIRMANDGNPYLAVNTPYAGLQTGVPATVTWSAREGAFTALSLFSSIDGGRTFTAVPGCTNLPATAVQCTWKSPGPASDQARLRLVGASTNGDWIAVSDSFRISAEPVLPTGWASRDIGAVQAAGKASFANGTWTVEGSGADIWDVADEFRYAYQIVSGNFTVTARVSSIENVNRWVKAGLMVL